MINNVTDSIKYIEMDDTSIELFENQYKVPETGAAAPTDCAAGLAWQKDCVSRALGQVEAYEDTKNPSYYGDIFSFAVRAGGSSIRSDKKGVVLLYQGTPA